MASHPTERSAQPAVQLLLGGSRVMDRAEKGSSKSGSEDNC